MLSAEEIEEIKELLKELLPHGSGINYKWEFKYRPRLMLFDASNRYCAMDEWGGYCHEYPFTASFQYHGKNASEPCQYCKGIGYRSFSEMIAYNWTIEKWEEQNPEAKLYEEDGELRFLCNVCHGEKLHHLPVFEMKRLEFGHEYVCCGIGTKDYLWQILGSVE